jgi:hypothetical protein
MSDNNTRVLQSPEVRASDGQKVSLKIGDKVPYATGSFQPGIGTVGVSPLVSTQFQFAETGVNVEITPHVHGVVLAYELGRGFITAAGDTSIHIFDLKTLKPLGTNR